MREIDGNIVKITKNRDPKKNNRLDFLIKESGIDLPIHSAKIPTISPAICRFTKKRDVPNVSSAYTELEE
jgi:hypothetical protein